MKSINKILFSTCGILLFPLLLTATSNESKLPEFELSTYKVEDIALPVPVKVGVPQVNGRLGGHQVRILFNIRADGRTGKIRQAIHSPEQIVNDLAEIMKMAIRNWRFEPARDKNGNAIAIKVALPVKVTKNKGSARGYAKFSFAKPVVLARVN